MIKKKYFYIGFNIFIFISTLKFWTNLYFKDESIVTISTSILLIFLAANIFAFTIDFIFNKLFKWYEKRSTDKYNLHQWMGNPDSPINFEEFSSFKDFEPNNFIGNCILIKEIINKALPDLNQLKSYKTFLELKSSSPRLNSLLSSTQTIFIAAITSSLITFLNFTNLSGLKMFLSYIFFLVFFVGLMNFIDFMSKAIDRDKLLLVLVNECIQEKEKEKEKLKI